MSAILSADDLNDFINPGVACIKPVETLPQQQPADGYNAYEVTTEDKVNSGTIAPPAQISLTDCLACSGCVTSAEAVLVSLQSHGEVLDTLDKYSERDIHGVCDARANLVDDETIGDNPDSKVFIASVSPQSRASLAATYGVSEREAGYMISQLLSGPLGVRSGGKYGSGFAWVVDTNAMREASLVAAADEVQRSMPISNDPQKTPTMILNTEAEGSVSTSNSAQKKPIITSACPGWICYVEKTLPYVLPHLSKLKSPQALTGVLLKSALAKRFGIPPQSIWHLAIMPCFDKKLEASRSELTSRSWHNEQADAVRDVDCVITARELLMLAESRGISFPALPKKPLPAEFVPRFPDSIIDDYLFGRRKRQKRKREESDSVGTSGGYLYHILLTQQSRFPGSKIESQRGRNSDVSEYAVVKPSGEKVFTAARYYGFRNIRNLVSKLDPNPRKRMRNSTGVARKLDSSTVGSIVTQYDYVEVMACPGGCTNGGGQIKVGDVATLRQVGGTGIENGSVDQDMLLAQRDWLTKVDEAYWSAESDDLSPSTDTDGDTEMEYSATNETNISNGTHADVVDGIDRRYVGRVLDHWAHITGVDLEVLLQTSYRVVESDVGKNRNGTSNVDRVSALAHAAGGGW